MDRPFLNSVKYPRCPARSFHALARGGDLFRRRRRSRHTPARGLPVVVVEALSTSLHLVWTVCLFPACYEPSFSISTVGLLAGGKAKTTNGSDNSRNLWLSSAVPVDPLPVNGHDTQNLLGKTCWVKPAFSNFHPRWSDRDSMPHLASFSREPRGQASSGAEWWFLDTTTPLKMSLQQRPMQSVHSIRVC